MENYINDPVAVPASIVCVGLGQLAQSILNPLLRLQLAQGRQVVLKNYTNGSLAQRFAQTIENVVV